MQFTLILSFHCLVVKFWIKYRNEYKDILKYYHNNLINNKLLKLKIVNLTLSTID